MSRPVSTLGQPSEMLSRPASASTNNMTAGSSKVQTASRDPNAAPITAPLRNAIHSPPNSDARRQCVSHDPCASTTGALLIPIATCCAKLFKSPVM